MSRTETQKDQFTTSDQNAVNEIVGFLSHNQKNKKGTNIMVFTMKPYRVAQEILFSLFGRNVTEDETLDVFGYLSDLLKDNFYGSYVEIVFPTVKTDIYQYEHVQLHARTWNSVMFLNDGNPK